MCCKSKKGEKNREFMAEERATPKPQKQSKVDTFDSKFKGN
jgi:hypothetical protein